MTATICAKYKNVDGWHVFYSDDLPSLYVAHPDAQTAFNDVAPSIRCLLKLTEGLDVQVQPAQDFKSFLRALKHEDDAVDESLVMSSRQFLIGTATA